jgi:hypothetical protein
MTWICTSGRNSIPLEHRVTRRTVALGEVVRGGVEGAGSGVRARKREQGTAYTHSCQWPEPAPILESFPVSPSTWASSLRFCIVAPRGSSSSSLSSKLAMPENEINSQFIPSDNAPIMEHRHKRRSLSGLVLISASPQSRLAPLSRRWAMALSCIPSTVHVMVRLHQHRLVNSANSG